MSMVEHNRDFWAALDALVASSRLVIDRPRDSSHPRYPEMVYPLDYSYLEGTRSPDGGGIDVWVGSLPKKRVGAVVINEDLFKRESEIKLLLGCTADEQRIVQAMHQGGAQSALLVTRPESTN